MAASWHPTGPPVQPEPHVESPASKQRLNSLVEVSGIGQDLHRIVPRHAERDEITRFHDPEYVDRIKTLSGDAGGDAGETAAFGRGSYEIALLSAGGCLAAVDSVLTGEVDNAYALVRPPGHHAEADRGRGFCIFGNVALAAMHARENFGLTRIAVIDWDVHHGNGTESAFYADPGVLTISLHQDNLYPLDRGRVKDQGSGPGEGFNINIPLPPGSGPGAYLGTFDRVVEPALRDYQPELIIVAAGFDSGAMDPLGRMILSADDYRDMTRRVLALADNLCSGRLLICHEGGYSSPYVPFCGLAVIEELLGERTWVEDPFGSEIGAMAYRDLQIHQNQVIESVEATFKSRAFDSKS